MVNMVGFHHKEPVYQVPAPGEEGFYLELREKPTNNYPKRARVSFPSGWAAFNDREHAGLFLNHPGAIPYAARHYIAWLDGEAS